MILLFAMVAFLFVYAAYTDTRRLIIENWIPFAIMLAYAARCIAFPDTVNISGDLVVFAIAFGVGYALFHLGWFGGGDIKLVMAGCLWFGQAYGLEFALIATALGGVESLAVVFSRAYRPMLTLASVWVPVLVADTKVIPYGIAITSSALILLYLQFNAFGVA